MQVTPSLLVIASSVVRLSNLIVSGDHTKPISSDLSFAYRRDRHCRGYSQRHA